MKGYFINVKEGFSEVVDVEDKLDVFYEKIGCSYIDIVSRKIGGVHYDIVCDEEGTFSERPIISAASISGEPMLVGNLLIFNHDGKGELSSLDDDDIKRIKQNIYLAVTDNEVWQIVQAEY